MKDHYTTLGIERDASQQDIKKAFRSLAHTHHPDKGGDVAKFKEVSEAYQVLSDPEVRTQYDRFGHAGHAAFGGGQQGTANRTGFQETDFNTMNAQYYSQYATKGVKAVLIWQIIKKVPVVVWVITLPLIVVFGVASIVLLLVFGTIRKGSKIA